MKHRHVARRFVARVLTVAMTASLALQSAPMTAFATDGIDPESQGGGVESTLEDDRVEEPVVVTEETPAESPADEAGEDIPVLPEINPDTTEDEAPAQEAPAEDVIVLEETSELITMDALGADLSENDTVKLTVGTGAKFTEDAENASEYSEGTYTYTIGSGEDAGKLANIVAALTELVEVKSVYYKGTVKFYVNDAELSDDNLTNGVDVVAKYEKKEITLTTTPDFSSAINYGSDTTTVTASATGDGIGTTHTFAWGYKENGVPEGGHVVTFTSPDANDTSKIALKTEKAGSETLKLELKDGEDVIAEEEITVTVKAVLTLTPAAVTVKQGGKKEIKVSLEGSSAAVNITKVESDKEGVATAAIKGESTDTIEVTGEKASEEKATITVTANELTATAEVSVRDHDYSPVNYIYLDLKGAVVSGVTDNSGNPKEFENDDNAGLETAIPLLIENVSATDYAFLGWYVYDPVKKTWGNKVEQIPAGQKDGYTVYGKFAKEYAITYTVLDKDGETIGTDQYDNTNTAVKYHAESANIPLNPIVKDGNTFDGWYTSKSDDGKLSGKVNFLTATHFKSEDGIELFGRLTETSKFTISYEFYDQDGHKLSNVTNPSANLRAFDKDKDEKFTLTDASKTGYIFQGWYREKAFENKYEDNAEINPNSDLTIYGSFKAADQIASVKFTKPTAAIITLEDGDTQEVEAKLYNEEDEEAATNETVKYTTSDSSIAAITKDGDKLVIEAVGEGTATITAKPSKTTGVSATIKVVVSKTVVAPNTVTVSYGSGETKKEFTGIEDSNVITVYDNGSAQTIQFTSVVYGDKGSADEAPKATVQDVVYTLEPENTEYFTISSNGRLTIKKTPANASTTANLIVKSAIDGEVKTEITLKSVKQYDLSFATDHAVESLELPKTEKAETGVKYTPGEANTTALAGFVANTTKDKGYTFKGWYVQGDEEKTVVDFDSWTMPDKNTTLVAKWDADKSSISYKYKKVDGTTTSEEITGTDAWENKASFPVEYTVESEEINLDDPSLEDYDFIGWYQSDYTTAVTVKPVAVNKDNPVAIEVYALFKKSVAGISFGQNNVVVHEAGKADLSYAVTVAPNDHGYQASGDPAVVYSSSNEDVATIDQTGKVSTKADATVGDETVIKATLIVNGESFTDQFTLKIISSEEYKVDVASIGNISVKDPVDDLEVNTDKEVVAKGGSDAYEFDADATDLIKEITFQAEVAAADNSKTPSITSVSWSVDKPAFATIDKDGKLTLTLDELVKDDVITVTATADGNKDKTATVTLKVVKNYKVTFEKGTGAPNDAKFEGTNDQTVTKSVKYEGKVAEAEIPKLTGTGFTVSKWVVKGVTPEREFTTATEVKADVTVVPVWTRNEHDVKAVYLSAAGASSKIIEDKTPGKIAFGADIRTAKVPEYEAIITGTQGEFNGKFFRFLGWYDSADWKTVLTRSTKKAADEDLNIYAMTEQVAKVEFSAGTGVTFTSNAPAEVYVKDGEKVSEPAATPTAEGKKFEGWYKEATFENEVDFTSTLKPSDSDYATITYYAKWADEAAYDIVLVKTLPGVETPSSDTTSVEYGKAYTPAALTETYYDFGGWYTDEALNKPWVDGTVMTESTVTKATDGKVYFYAKWTAKTANVAFYLGYDADGDGYETDEYLDTTVAYNSKVVRPAAPQRTNYVFAGWYETLDDAKAQTSGKEFNFDTTVTALTPIEVYAAWTSMSDVFGADEMIIVTNNYPNLAEVQSKILAEKNAKWGASVTGDLSKKSTASLAGKVAVPMEVEIDGESYTVPFRFITINKLELVPEATALSEDGSSTTVRVVPVLTGGTYVDSTIKNVVDKEIVKAVSANVTTSGSLKAQIESDYLSIIATQTGVPAKKQTAKVNLSMKFADGKERKASASITISPKKYVVENIVIEDLTAENEEDGIAAYWYGSSSALPKGTTKKLTASFADAYTDVKANVSVKSDNTGVVKTGAVVWEGSQKKTRANADDQNFSVPLTFTGKPGTARITITANDAEKTVSEVLVVVQSTEALFSTKKVTVNMLMINGAAIDITPAFDTGAPEFNIAEVKAPKKVTATADELKNWFYLNETDEVPFRYELGLDADADVSKLVAGKYTVTVDDGAGTRADLTVTLTAKAPAITVKQSAAINLTQSWEEGARALIISSKAAEITDAYVVADPATAPYIGGTFNQAYMTLMVMKNDQVAVTAKSNKKITVAFDCTGYRKGAVTKTVTLKVANKLPAFKADPATITFYPSAEMTETTVTVMEGKLPAFIRSNSVEITSTGKFADNYEFTPDIDTSSRTLTIKVKALKTDNLKAVSDKIYVQLDEYSAPIPVTLKLATVADAKKFAPKLSASKVTLHRLAPHDGAVVRITNKSGVEDVKYEFVGVTGTVPANVAFDVHDDMLLVYWDDAEKMPTTNTKAAKVKVKVVALDSSDDQITDTVKELPLTISIVGTELNGGTKNNKAYSSKVVKFTQKGSIDLMNPESAVTLTAKVSGLNATMITATMGTPVEKILTLTGRDAAMFQAVFEGTWKLKLAEGITPDQVVTGHKYDVRIGTVVAGDGQTEVFVNQALNVKITQSKPKLTLTPKSATGTKLNNAKGMVYEITPNAVAAGKQVEIASVTGIYDKSNNHLFEVSFDDGGVIKLTQTGTLKKGTYTVKFLVKFKDQAANAKDTIVSYKITVK